MLLSPKLLILGVMLSLDPDVEKLVSKYLRGSVQTEGKYLKLVYLVFKAKRRYFMLSGWIST